jgi:hypothetical protein
VEDDTEAFAKAAVQLYQEADSWKRSQGHGAVIINQLYSKEKLSRRLKERLQEVEENLQSHRQQHFIGSILQHHTMESTKYMSRWIEEKNKN